MTPPVLRRDGSSTLVGLGAVRMLEPFLWGVWALTSGTQQCHSKPLLNQNPHLILFI